MPKAKKLPSGSWRVQVYAGKDSSGKAQYKSFTHPDKDKAELAAAEFKVHHREVVRDSSAMTLKEAIKRYIASKDGILSPSTIAGYNRIKKNCLQGIMEIKLRDLTTGLVDAEINTMSKTKSPKYVRNAHGLLSAVLKNYRPDFALRTALPQKQRYMPEIPETDYIQKIITIVQGTTIELPVLLALWLGLRMSEIRGIKWDAVKGDVLFIKNAIVDCEKVPTVKNTTKTYSSARKLKLPTYLLQLIEAQPKDNEFVIQLSGQAIYKRFVRLCEKNGLPHFRFHDLRHANATVMLALNISDKIAMERGGWSTNRVLKDVYQHVMTDKRTAADKAVNSYFENMVSHEISHGNENIEQ